MDTCFFCNEAIENEDEYILIGLVQDEAAELVPAHQDCAKPARPIGITLSRRFRWDIVSKSLGRS